MADAGLAGYISGASCHGESCRKRGVDFSHRQQDDVIASAVIFLRKQQKMDVRTKPLSKSVMFLLGVFTLGAAPIAIKLTERKWPKLVDEDGLVTRAGKRIRWDEFTKIVKVVTRSGPVITERYELRSSNGRVQFVAHRVENSEAVFQYIWDHLPPETKTSDQECVRVS